MNAAAIADLLPLSTFRVGGLVTTLAFVPGPGAFEGLFGGTDNSFYTTRLEINTVPEPGAFGLVFAALAAFCAARFRKRH